MSSPETNKTLKQIFREHGYEVNRDNQKGLGNKCLEEATKGFRDLIKQRLTLAEAIDESELDSHARSYLNGVKGELDKLLEELM
jgi:hypothetical protein